MFISPTNAVKMYDVSKPTLYKDMSEGKLSFTKDDRDRRKINVAELDRLYEKREDTPADLTSANVKNGEAFTEPNVKHQQLSQQVKAFGSRSSNLKTGRLSSWSNKSNNSKTKLKI